MFFSVGPVEILYIPLGIPCFLYLTIVSNVSSETAAKGLLSFKIMSQVHTDFTTLLTKLINKIN